MKRTVLGFFWMMMLISMSAYADDDMQMWIPIKAQGHFTDNILWSMDMETRMIDDISEFGSQSVAPALGWKINENWSIWQGFKWEGKYDNASDTWGHEYRPYQQLSAVYKFGDFAIKSRTRFEERIFANGDDMSLRFRQQVRGEYALSDSWFLAASEEMFVNANDTVARPDGFSQNRLYGGVGYKMTPNATLEMGYMRRWDNGFSGSDKDTNILMTTMGFSF